MYVSIVWHMKSLESGELLLSRCQQRRCSTTIANKTSSVPYGILRILNPTVNRHLVNANNTYVRWLLLTKQASVIHMQWEVLWTFLVRV